LHGGALLGIAYRTSRRVSAVAATAISTIQSMPLSGYGTSASSFNTFDDGLSPNRSPVESSPLNFQLYRWVILFDALEPAVWFMGKSLCLMHELHLTCCFS